MNIADICTRQLVLADKDASLQQAASLMREHHVGTLVVVEHTNAGLQAVGVVTDRDVVIDAVAHEMAEIARVARAGIEREGAERGPLAASEPAAAVRIPEYTLA